jgi:hypothetical protein
MGGLGASNRRVGPSVVIGRTLENEEPRRSPRFGSGRANIGEEAIDVGAQCRRLAAELLGRRQNMARRRSRLVGRLVDGRDVARNLAGALGGFLHVAGDLLGRGSFSLPDSQAASRGRSFNTKKAARPITTGSIPSIRKSHCQLLNPRKPPRR